MTLVSLSWLVGKVCGWSPKPHTAILLEVAELQMMVWLSGLWVKSLMMGCLQGLLTEQSLWCRPRKKCLAACPGICVLHVLHIVDKIRVA